MPRFSPGASVNVDDHPVTGHVRTPRYIRGKTGVVERVCGAFGKPEDLAYGKWDGEPSVLYRVRFRQRDVWPDYAGADGDTVDVEIYEHWLR